MTKDDLSGADIKAVCTEAGLLALRERRMRVTKEDFTSAREKVLYRKDENTVSLNIKYQLTVACWIVSMIRETALEHACIDVHHQTTETGCDRHSVTYALTHRGRRSLHT